MHTLWNGWDLGAASIERGQEGFYHVLPRSRVDTSHERINAARIAATRTDLPGAAADTAMCLLICHTRRYICMRRYLTLDLRRKHTA